ncbi:MAG: pyridoxamine 5'-phosphate oxidase family protein [Clostridia bacterium]|nr:pyridoxamine 5'-phosphate oxidase family protein [Clostridia bacterium]
MTIEMAYSRFLDEFGPGKAMVLSTAVDGQVSSRTMSVVLLNGAFYFQTDCTLRKYRQLVDNPRAALCAGNVSLEGICEEIGAPAACPAFCTAYSECFPGSFERYSGLNNERVFRFVPTRLERWLYIDAEPYMEVFDFAKNTYDLSAYEGK